jgi:hypothetical protein
MDWISEAPTPPDDYVSGLLEFDTTFTDIICQNSGSFDNWQKPGMKQKDNGEEALEGSFLDTKKNEEAGRGFAEFVFEATPVTAKLKGPGRKGRKGPLCKPSREMMSHIRKINACWRCAILTKKVSLYHLELYLKLYLKYS